MKKMFRLKGLNCANCASKMESGIKKIDGVNSAAVNFITTKLTIDFDEEKMEAIIESIKLIIKKYEPEVKLEKA